MKIRDRSLSLRVHLEDSGLALELEKSPLGSGGEAAIFAVPELPNRVAKIYHRATREHADKLAAMLAAPPLDPGAGAGHVSIAWPVKRLLATTDAARVVGYLMPRVHQARLIQEFYNPKARALACPLFHFGYLVRTAQPRDLGAAPRTRLRHRDLRRPTCWSRRPSDVVDTDSFQVPPNRIFRCRVARPNTRLRSCKRACRGGPRTGHDAFGLAVLIFQLLMQGTHPFAGLYTVAANAGHTAASCRILALCTKQLVPFQPSPHAPPWHVLPPAVQELTRRCFEDGHERPTLRPTARDWQRALQEAEQALIPCAVNSQHVYHRELDRCPWCALAAQQGRDPFPSVEAAQALAQANAALETVQIAMSKAEIPVAEPAAKPQAALAKPPRNEGATRRRRRTLLDRQPIARSDCADRQRFGLFAVVLL